MHSLNASSVFAVAASLLRRGTRRVAVRGASATGKSEVAAKLACEFERLVGGSAVLVVESEDALFASRELVGRLFVRAAQAPSVVTIEDFWEAPMTADLLVFDDADRYRLPPTSPETQVVLVGDLQASFEWDAVQGAHLEITASRMPAPLAKVLEMAHYPTYSLGGVSAEPQVIRHGGGRLPAALTLVGVCPVLSELSAEASLLDSALKAVESALELRVQDRLSPNPRRLGSNEVRLVRIGGDGFSTAAPWSLLEDLARERPPIAVVVCFDDDDGALRRVAGTVTTGLVVVTRPGSPLLVPRIANLDLARRGGPDPSVAL